MIDFRYHVVSIVAVFLALTVGLVLGASFLSKYAVDELKVQITGLTTDKNNLQQANRSANTTLSQLDSYIGTTANSLVSGYLNGEYATVVQISGEDTGSTAAMLGLVGTAGATVTSNITINPSFTDPASAPMFTQLVTGFLPVGQTAAGSTPAAQAVNLLAEALSAPAAIPDTGGQVTTPASGMTLVEATATLKAFAADGLIANTTLPTGAVRPNLALLVAPTAANTPDQNAIYISLAQALRTDGAQPMVAGSAIGGSGGSAQPGGLIDAVLKNATASRQVATVDNTNTTMGQVSVVFTLYQNVTPPASAGHFGIIGATDGLLPKLPVHPTPTPTGTATPGSGGATSPTGTGTPTTGP